MKKLLMIAAIALLAVACNKNQRAVKKLDGTWDATIWTVTDGGSTTDVFASGVVTEYQFEFDACKLKDDEFCTVRTKLVTTVGEGRDTALFRVTNDGLTLETKEELSSTTINSIEIVELTGSLLKVKQVDEGDGFSEITFEKK